MDKKVINDLCSKAFQLDEVFHCIHSPDDEGVVALCVACSCHPDRGGLFLEAAVKYKLSLSQSIYLAILFGLLWHWLYFWC